MFPKARTALSEVHLVENSRSMRSIQETVLGPVCKDRSIQLVWHDSIDDIPHDDETYTMAAAHEFFDALPFHLLQVVTFPTIWQWLC
jgi:NADH dehydrogenase [ubiquinone] 1 alpha subcomplex assembly factor 7